jgi:hypothetical protein
MNGREFVEAIKLYVRDASVKDQLDSLMSPPGRRPSQHEKLRSEWFRGLKQQDRDYVESIILDSVNAGIFHLLCVVDGVSVIDENKGDFELKYIGKESVILNDTDGLYLHEWFNS